MLGRALTIAGLSLLIQGRLYSNTQVFYTPEEIRKVLSLTLGEENAEKLQIPFEANENIQNLAKSITKGADSDSKKLSSLLAYFKKQGFQDRFDRDGTKTAIEVLKNGRGNCLSYANLFIALARSVGLKAFYLDGSEKNHELDHAQGLLVDYGHVLVGVRIGPKMVSVDFDGRPRESRHLQVLSDFEAVADFYNNLGFERADMGDGTDRLVSMEVIQAFQLATRIQPRFARAWNNLGVVLRKIGSWDEAKNAYEMAVKIDPELSAPHANLGHVWMKKNEAKEAIAEYRKAVHHSPENAYYHYFLGKALERIKEWEEALGELETAAKLGHRYYLIQMDLARIHIQLNHRQKAINILRRLLWRFPDLQAASRLLDEALELKETQNQREINPARSQ